MNVYKGSVVVDFNVISEPVVVEEQTTNDDSELTEEEKLAKVEAAQTEAQAAAQENLKKVKSDLTTLITS